MVLSRLVKTKPVTLPSQLPLVTLVGNPNTGKTTLFNGLCRTHQKTGNYPGSTIEKKSGYCQLGQGKAQILDLPGLYSLRAISPDEKISRDGLLGHIPAIKHPDLLLFVLDATNLRRNLFLFSQVSELGLPVVVVLTMQDQMQKAGVKLDVKRLEHELGVPAVPVVSYRIEDINYLKTVIEKALLEKPVAPPFRSDHTDEQKIIQELYTKLNAKASIKKPFSFFEVRELLSEHQGHLGLLKQKYITNDSELKPQIQDLQQRYHELIKKNPALPTLSRYRWIDSILKKIKVQKQTEGFLNSQKWDQLFTHRFWGPCIFVALMYFMFQSIYTWAEPAMLGIETIMGYLGDIAAAPLVDMPILRSLVQDGVISGVGSVLIFLPQIIILFFFISILEDSGYLVRAAFLMDRLFSWSGLNGRAFVPLLSSFACAIPGILSTRVMPEHRVRLSTILIAPLMSCSARLPIYLLLIGAMIAPIYGPAVATLSLFLMHAVGVVVALPLVWVFNRGLQPKLPNNSFIMEFPPYRKPRAYNVFLRVQDAAKKFTIKAGTIIFFLSIVIWAMAYFPKTKTGQNPSAQQSSVPEMRAIREPPAQTQLRASYLGQIGSFLTPVFAPLGFDWKITVGILSAFPAREVLVSTLGIIYNVQDASEGSKDLRERIRTDTYADGRPVYTPLVAISLMIFFALCSQCMGTLAVIRKELGKWKWAVFVFGYMTSLAYLLSFLVYQGGRFLGYT